MTVNNEKIIPSSSRVQMNTYVWLLKQNKIPASESSSTQNTREDEDTFLEKRLISLQKTKQKVLNKSYHTRG